uniref:AlNc14C293G10265 protein n=1 Tax=Albugo laibachii Nc14 TaxID=890382 RepID=F0WVC1_9STRA|nr:AlNc14C293G10265 [Albugo laibachii Nc14]|eukprot:CCA25360.1 AlNc14C293G10265 [Albugo laibachii Nc14]
MNSFVKKLTIKAYPTSTTSWFLWANELNNESWKALKQRISGCQIRRRCLEVQILPETVCEEHEEYMNPVFNQKRSNIEIQFPADYITGQLWPRTNPTRKDGFRPGKRAVLLVRIETKNVVTCFRCLVLRSDVFSVYAGFASSNTGYVWMTQNHDDIIRPCLHQDCSKLSCYYENQPLQLGYLRPLCNSDIDKHFPWQRPKTKK